MSKILRQTAQIFGISSGADQIEQFGSLAAGSPNYISPGASNAVETLQALSAWLEGWFGGVVGSELPAIEDLNAFCFVDSYQIAYMLQSGIPEWDAGTTYYTGSLVTGVGTGIIYRSLIDNNTNNAVSVSADWAIVGSSNLVNESASTYVMTAADNGKTFLTNTTSAPVTYTLPSPALNFKIKIKDSGNAQTNNITINPHSAETIDGQSSIVMSFPYGYVELTSDGTNWFVTDQSKNISAWTSYTPTVTGWTVANQTGMWRRNGQNVEIIAGFTYSAGAATAATITLPSGLLSASWLNAVVENFVGSFIIGDTGAFAPCIKPGATSNVLTFGIQSASTEAGNFVNGADLASNSGGCSVDADCPINGWTNY